eukprot:7639780-Pyramimonas_sp.AAC.2
MCVRACVRARSYVCMFAGGRGAEERVRDHVGGGGGDGFRQQHRRHARHTRLPRDEPGGQEDGGGPLHPQR